MAYAEGAASNSHQNATERGEGLLRKKANDVIPSTRWWYPGTRMIEMLLVMYEIG